nr:MAG TPA: hypothetical protein [Caudoviricetes sp.]
MAGRVYYPVPEAPSAVSRAIFTREKKRVFMAGARVIDLRGR